MNQRDRPMLEAFDAQRKLQLAIEDLSTAEQTHLGAQKWYHEDGVHKSFRTDLFVSVAVCLACVDAILYPRAREAGDSNFLLANALTGCTCQIC